MRWAGNVARTERGEAYTGYWWGNLRDRDHLGDPGVDGRVTLRWIFRKWDGGHGLECSGTGQGHVAGTCKRGNETSVSIKYGEFLELRTG